MSDPTGEAYLEAGLRRRAWLTGLLWMIVAANALFIVLPLLTPAISMEELDPVNRVLMPSISIAAALALLGVLRLGYLRHAARVVVVVSLLLTAASLAHAYSGEDALQTGLSLSFFAVPPLLACLFLSTLETALALLSAAGLLLGLAWPLEMLPVSVAVRGIEIVAFFGLPTVLISHLNDQDLRDLHRASAEHARLQALLVVTDRLSSLGIVAASAGHELNNAMTVLQTSLDLAAEIADEQGARSVLEALEEVDDGAASVRQLIGDLTRLGRDNDGEVSRCDPVEAVQSVLRLMHPLVQRRATLDLSVEPVSPVGISRTRLGQVVLNLVQNATQALPQDSTPQSNTIRVCVHSPSSGEIDIEVEDDGPGMTAEVRERATQPFFTTKDANSGSGLGLHICAQLVERAGGTLDIVSTPGGGTTVRVRLPVAA